MMPSAREFLKAASLVAVLAAGSCAAPVTEGGLLEDPIANHPIDVQPSYHSLKLSFSAPDAGLLPDDAQHFNAFVAAYLQHGNGAVSISAPGGHDAQATIAYFGERLAQAGVPRDHILVGTHDPGKEPRVELGYIGYVASTASCGDWSDDLAYTLDNRVPHNFGCANQQNLAAEVADPRDLIEPRPMGPADAVRRATVYDNYKQGKPTAAELTQDQSGAVADVNK